MVLSLGFMLILNFANVVSRYLLSSTIAFTEEITTNLFVWSCFIGAAAAAKRGSHLGFDLLLMNLPKKLQRIVTALVTIVTLSMFALLFFLSITKFPARSFLDLVGFESRAF